MDDCIVADGRCHVFTPCHSTPLTETWGVTGPKPGRWSPRRTMYLDNQLWSFISVINPLEEVCVSPVPTDLPEGLTCTRPIHIRLGRPFQGTVHYDKVRFPLSCQLVFSFHSCDVKLI